LIARRLKLGASKVSVYRPTGNSPMTYSPELLVTTVRVNPVASFSAVTLAPTIAAPPGSVTKPRNEPVVTCAWEITVTSAATKTVEEKIRK
jgi:hypothetical protein